MDSTSSLDAKNSKTVTLIESDISHHRWRGKHSPHGRTNPEF